MGCINIWGWLLRVPFQGYHGSHDFPYAQKNPKIWGSHAFFYSNWHPCQVRAGLFEDDAEQRGNENMVDLWENFKEISYTTLFPKWSFLFFLVRPVGWWCSSLFFNMDQKITVCFFWILPFMDNNMIWVWPLPSNSGTFELLNLSPVRPRQCFPPAETWRKH